MRHAAEIRKQIVSREQKRIRDRQNYFEEAEKKISEEIGKILVKDAKLPFLDHRQKLRDVKLRKLDQLRRAGVPEKYCSEVMRRAFDDGQKKLGH